MKEETLVEDANPIAQEDTKKTEMHQPGADLAAFVESFYQRSKVNRSATEQRWLKAYQNFRGRYGEDTEFLDTEISRVFVKVTKTKTLAAYGQLLDVLLSGPRFPIAVGPTETPLGTMEAAHIDPSQGGAKEATPEPSLADVDPIGYKGDGNEVLPGDTMMVRMKRIVAKQLSLGDKDAEIKEGAADKPGMITVNPAEIAGHRMTQKIQDQLTETKMPREFRKFLFEMCMLGSGVLKGPFLTEKEYPRWNEEGEYDPVFQNVPKTTFVSCWNIYNDPDAPDVENSQGILERHKMSRSDFTALKKQRFFKTGAINAALELGANYKEEYWERTLTEGTDTEPTDKFEVKEYWGVVPVSKLIDLPGLKLPAGTDPDGEVNANVWINNGMLIRVVLNPFKPARIPYYVCPYEEDPYNFFGVGLPENMEDSQQLMNGFARMSVDNAVLAGNIMLEVDTDNLANGTSMDMYAGKIWEREGGGPGQTINAIQFPNTAQSNMMMYDKFRQLADEGTGISSFSHGQTGVSGVGRTAAGISMLMGAASGAIKTVIKNVDDYVLEPMGNAYFAWNNQFDFDPSLVGDLEVKAQGVASLMSKEIKSQRILQFIQVAAGDQEMSMRLNKEYLTKEIARTLELDPDMAVLSEEEFQLKVSLGIYEQQVQQGQPGMAVGGDMGVGAPAMPGEAGFSGTPQQTGPQEAPIEPPQGMNNGI